MLYSLSNWYVTNAPFSTTLYYSMVVNAYLIGWFYCTLINLCPFTTKAITRSTLALIVIPMFMPSEHLLIMVILMMLCLTVLYFVYNIVTMKGI